MPTVLGVDCSSWQPPNLPWKAWFDFGVRRAHIRASLGYRQDSAYPAHRAAARAVGMKTGLYHYLMHHDDEIDFFDPARQAQVFVGRFLGGDELPAVVDVETTDPAFPGVNDAHLWAFIAEYERLTDHPLMIYTSKYFWDLLIGPGRTRYSRFPFWIAQYSPTLTLIPDVARIVAGHQFRFQSGYLPGYTADIDVNYWFDEPTLPAPPAVIRARGKVGPQINVTGDSDATDWLLRGQPSAAVGIDAGPPGEVTTPAFFVARRYENAWNPTDPQRDGYSGEPLADARRYADIWYKTWLPLNPWVWLLATPNEPVVHTVAEMTYCAAFLAELVRIIHEDYRRTAVVGNWSVGSPDFPLWEHYGPALAAIAKHGAIHARHSYGPLTEFYALRHRRDNTIFAALGYANLPTLLTECGWENIPDVDRAWGSEPRRTPREYTDYLLALNDELMRDAYVLGASVFTYGLNWGQHNLNGSGVGRLMADALAVRPLFELAWPQPRPAEVEEPMDLDKVRASLTRIGAEQAKITASVERIDVEQDKITASVAVIDDERSAIQAEVDAETEPVHDLHDKTNQYVVNLFNMILGGYDELKRAIPDWEQSLAGSQAIRARLYTGPSIEAMPLTDAEKAALVAALDAP